MTKDEIIAEMQRKPDPQVLLEWIHGELQGWHEDPVVREVADALDGYFDAVEQRGYI